MLVSGHSSMGRRLDEECQGIGGSVDWLMSNLMFNFEKPWMQIVINDELFKCSNLNKMLNLCDIYI